MMTTPDLTINVGKDESGNIFAFIMADGTPWIEQPFDPNTGKAWKSIAAANSWCEWWIADYQEQASRPIVEP